MPTINSIKASYRLYLSRLSKQSTRKDYTMRFNVFLTWCSMERIDGLEEINFHQFLDYVFLDRGVSPRTHNNYRTWLRSFIIWMRRQHLIEVDPMDGVPPMREQGKIRQPLPKVMLWQIREHLAAHDRHFLLAVMMEYYCFIRPEELSQLQVGDIDVKRHAIHVRASISKNGKAEMVGLNNGIVSLMRELGTLRAPKDWYIFSSQISFFISALKGAKSAGMAVMVAMHAAERMPLNGGEDNPFFQRASSDRWSSGYTTACNGTIIEDIVDAFRKGNSINKQYTFNNGAASITVDESFSGNGHFIAYMVGHSHVDSIGYSTEHPDQLYLMCPASCCVPNAAAQQTYSYGTECSDLPRVQNTKTEDCFNVYGIDTVHKRVKVVRVGADTNDLMEPREVAYFDYEPSQS